MTILLTMSFYGSLMGLVACGVSLLIHKVRAPRSVAMVLWALVALRLVCPVELTSRFSLLNAVPESARPAFAQTSTEIPAASAQTPAVTVQPPVVTVQPPAATNFPVTPQLSQPVQNVVRPPVTGLSQSSPAPAAAPAESVSTASVLTSVWAVGVGGFALWGVVSYMLLRRRLRFAMRLDADVYEVDTISTPCVVGFLRPRVYLPVELTPEQRLHTIAHERSHLQNRDHIWKLASYVALSVHWFNPLVWVYYFRFQQDMEMACDERVLRLLGPQVRADYSQSLLALAQKQQSVAPTPLAFSENTTKARITRVLKYKKPLTAVTAILLAAAIVLTGCVAAGPENNPSDPEETTPPQAEQTEPSEPVTEPDSWQAVTMEGLVRPRWQKHYKFIESVNGDAVEYYVACPEILLDGADAAACNLEMLMAFEPVPDSNDGDLAQKRKFDYNDVNYDAWVYEDTLTVCMWISLEYEYRYYIYTLDIYTGKLLTNGETADLMNVNLELMEQTIAKSISMSCGDYPQAEYDAILAANVSQENLERAILYPNSNGQPMLLYYFCDASGQVGRAAPLNVYETLAAMNLTELTVEPEPGTHESAGGLVDVYRQEHLSYTDTLNQTELEYTYVVPRILLNSGEADLCNQEMWDLCDPILDEAVQNAKDGYSCGYLDINYGAWTWENILTVCLWLKTPYDFVDYYAYAFDTETGERLTNEEVAQRLGTDPAHIRQSMAFWFDRRYGSWEDAEVLKEQRERTLSDENLAEAVLFPDEGGNPVIKCRIYSLAGAEYYPQLLTVRPDLGLAIPFTAETPEDAFQVFFNDIYVPTGMRENWGNFHTVTDCEIASWQIQSTKEDGSGVIIFFEMAVQAQDVAYVGLWAGNTRDGTGEYEGWLIMSREVCLLRLEDGRWYCHDIGTGGVRFP